MDKFKNKYRIPSARLQHWNYGAMGSYFITICTKNREHFFGEIIKDKMQLTELGKITEIEWLKTLELRPDMKLELGEFVVMPNHFHAIIIIGENEYNSQQNDNSHRRVSTQSDSSHCVSTQSDSTISETGNKFTSQSKNLASIVRGFKSAVTTYARKMGNIDFNWQTRFHDHIIRDAKSFDRIQNYISNNPSE